MPLATLSVDLTARLASLEAGFDKSYRLAEKNARAIEARYQRISGVFRSLGSTLAASFAGVSLVRVFTGVVDGIDRLNDLKDATGSSIENLSALEDVALRAGGSFDDVSQALIKFNQVLKDAKPDEGAGAVLKALNLDIEQLKRLDPAEALRLVAVAFSRYADDGEKARAMQELFGKSTKQTAAFLKDLAAEGELVAKVTTQQAEEAEKFNKQLAELSKNSLDFARSVSGPIISSLNEMIEKFKEGAKEGKSFYRVIYEEQLRLFGLGGGSGNGRSSSGVVTDPEGDRLRRQEDRGFLPSIIVPPDPKKPPRGPRSARDPSLTAEQIARYQLDAEEEAAKDAAEAWAIFDKYRLDESKARSEAEKQQWQQVFDFIDQEQERAIEEGQALIAETKKTNDVANQLGLTFSSAFEDAIVGGEKLSDVLRALEQDLIRIITRRLVTEPLADWVTGAVRGVTSGGGGGGGFLSSLFSGFFAEGGFIPPGRWGIAGERGPEPVFGGRTGATVRPSGGGMVVHQHFHVSGQVDTRTRSQLAADAQRGLAMAQRNL